MRSSRMTGPAGEATEVVADRGFSHIVWALANAPRAVATFALVVALCAMTSPALAQEGDAQARERALELFRESAELYRAGRFDDAAARLRAARELHDEPLLSYNLARALEGAGDLEGAVDAYSDYLDEAPDAEDAPAVRARLETLERHLAEVRALEADRERLRRSRADAERASSGGSAATTPTPPPSRGPDALPWALVGGGAAVLVVGGVLGGIAVARNQDAMSALDHAAAVAASDEAHGFATAANVFLITGGLVTLGSAIWGTIDLVSTSGGEGERASVELDVGPTGVAIRGAF